MENPKKNQCRTRSVLTVNALEPLITPAYRQSLGASAAVALDRFDRYLAAAHRSIATRRVYVAAVERWLRAGGAPGHVDRNLMLAYIGDRRGAVAAASVNVDVAALRAFYRIQAAFDDAPASSVDQIPRARAIHPRLHVSLDAERIAECVESIVLDGFCAVRDMTIIRVIAETGLRSGECLRLETGCVLNGELFVEGTAQRLDRYVPVSDSLSAALACYLSARGTLRPGKKVALWLQDDGSPLRGQNAVWRIFNRRLGDVAGARALRAGRPWQRPIYPHVFRAHYAVSLIASGLPLTAVSQLMGHADVATTARYLGADYRRLVEAIAHHPRASREIAGSGSANNGCCA